MEAQDLLEIQNSLVLKFMKKHIPNKMIVSKGLRDLFSHILTNFMLYIMTIATSISKEKKRNTVTIEDLKKAIEETGFEEEILHKLATQTLNYQTKTPAKVIETIEEEIKELEVEESDKEILEEDEFKIEEEKNFDIITE